MMAPEPIIASISPQVVARGGLATVRHRSGEEYKIPRSPIRYNEETIEEYVPAPDLGQHSREILAGVGYDEAEIEAMIGSGAIIEK